MYPYAQSYVPTTLTNVHMCARTHILNQFVHFDIVIYNDYFYEEKYLRSIINNNTVSQHMIQVHNVT